MRAVVQRVSKASVSFADKKKSISKGFVVLVAAGHKDSKEDAMYLAKKIVNLRIMADENGKMNKTLIDHNAEILLISQFTLFARTRKGNRPSFIDAADPKKAKQLYDELTKYLKNSAIKVTTGKFGEYMQVEIINDGPVTIIIDSIDKNKPRKSVKL